MQTLVLRIVAWDAAESLQPYCDNACCAAANCFQFEITHICQKAEKVHHMDPTLKPVICNEIPELGCDDALKGMLLTYVGLH